MAEAGKRGPRRRFLRAGFVSALAVSAALQTLWASAGPVDREFRINDRLSPLNKRRPLRPETLYIVLHTTEGPESGSLAEVWKRGETHYFVGLDGRVLRIIDRTKIATHAGRSMWQGNRNIDDYAIGIEVVGHYNQDITEDQYGALRELLRQLKEIYSIDDRHVLTHSMVAYGAPNRFHHSDHRGRKRCGMIFARPDVRLKLGLEAKPEHDADVEAGRLIVGDEELYRFLYAAAPVAASVQARGAATPVMSESNVVTRNCTPWMIARDRYDQPGTVYLMPDGKQVRGDQIRDWARIPEGTRVQISEADADSEQAMTGFHEIGKDGDDARTLAGDAYTRDTTIYFFPGGLIRTGRELAGSKTQRAMLDRPPKGTRVLIGYVYGGFVRSSRPASAIAGIKWNYPSTFYRLPDGRILSGDEIDDAAIPIGTLIFYQN
jgi:N-acetylmuramoyl-L-alanine amidase